MPEHDWSWSQDNISVRLAMEPAAIGAWEPRSVFETPHEVMRKLATEYGGRLETETSPLDRITFSGDWQPRIASIEGGQPIVPLQRTALQLLELSHSHPAGTYFAEPADVDSSTDRYEIPSLRPGSGMIQAERLTNVNEPIEGFYDRTTIGRELRNVDFEKHASLEERKTAIRDLIEQSGIHVETSDKTEQPIEIGNDAKSVVIPRQLGKAVHAHLATALYAVCIAKARQETAIAPNAREQATQTLAASWTVNMAFAGACLGQWPSAPGNDLNAAGRVISQDPFIMKRALDLNERLEQTLITQRTQDHDRTAPGETAPGSRRPVDVRSTEMTDTEQAGDHRSAAPVVRPQVAGPQTAVDNQRNISR